MTARLRRLPLMVALALAGASQTACSLFDSDFEGSVRLNFEVIDEDEIYQSIDLFNPNDDDDFRDNRDRIRTGTIESMEFRFTSINRAANRATLVVGQADVRVQGEESETLNPWIQGVSAWDGIQVVEGNPYFFDVPASRQEDLTRLVFEVEPDDLEPLEVRVDGRADFGPVDFNIEVTLNMVFTAGI